MAYLRTYATGRSAVYDVCRRILKFGADAYPRGLATKELLHETFVIEQPWDTVPTGINRAKLNPAMAALEALQNVAGVQRPDLFQRIAPQSSKFSMLLYGERLRKQLHRVVENLREDPWSRQAVALIWGHDDLGSGLESSLCTIGLQFILRDGRLHCATHMRSNDAWWGLAYDLPQFAWLQCSLANCLGVEPGPYVHSAGSMHLYERHFEAAAELTPPDGRSERCMGVGRAGDDWLEIQNRAYKLLYGNANLITQPTISERYIESLLHPYEPWRGAA